MQKGIIFVPFMTGKGGTETVINNLFKSIKSNKNLNLKVYSIGGSFNYDWTNGVNANIQEISNSRGIRTLYYLTFLPHKIAKIIKKEKPDFVISTNPVMWFLSKKIIKNKNLKIPVIAWYHYSLKQKPIRKMFLKSADYYFAISSGIKAQLISQGIPQECISLIYNPVDSNYYPISRPNDGITHFIYLGRVDLDKQKNVRELLTALQNVKGNWVLDIYGDDKKAAPAKELASQLNISEKINWKGFVTNPWSEIKNASVLTLTSNYEGLPMVLIEAISHGVCCVSSNIETGPIDIIKNGTNGYLYKPHEVNQLTELLQKIVNNQLPLPSQKQIIESSKKFSLDSYGKYLSNAIHKALN